MVHTHNEKMLPRSYSIAGWQQWLCITIDTVWCITTTGMCGRDLRLALSPSRWYEQLLLVNRAMGLILRIACRHRPVATGACWPSLTGAEITLS